MTVPQATQNAKEKKRRKHVAKGNTHSGSRVIGTTAAAGKRSSQIRPKTEGASGGQKRALSTVGGKGSKETT